MTDIYSYPTKTLQDRNGKITICSGPVVINKDNKILLHISGSTEKYQFIGGRLNDGKSLKENVIDRSEEVLGHRDIKIINEAPLCITGKIERDCEIENLVLFHYSAKLDDETKIGDAEWKSLDEIIQLFKQDMLSSKNIVIASKYFLKK